MWTELIEKIESLGISFDEFLILYKMYSYENNVRDIPYSSDMINTYLELESKNLIRIIENENGALTFFLRENGTVMIDSFLDKPDTTNKTVKTPIKDKNHMFEEFWLTFPSSDEHSIYKKTRILKAGKDACKRKYIDYIKAGADHNDIIKALKYEIKLRRDSNNGQNKMTFMKNSLTWLNSKEFEIILETMEEDVDSNNSSDDWTTNRV